MKKVYFLSTCSTCSRIIKELGIGDEFIYVRANAISRPGMINQTFVNELQNELSEKIQKQVVLEVGIIEEPVIKSANNLITPKKNLGMPD